MSKFIAWLKSLFIQSSEESNQMSEPLNDAATLQPGYGNSLTANTGGGTASGGGASGGSSTLSQTATPAAEVKAGVQDFEAALSFVENGVAQLGAAAKDELKALAKKYL